jgi:DNA-binding transcriptional MerR regulator
VDLARPHGLTPQAVRNYERRGVIPASRRTGTGYRIYTRRHAVALDAYLALVAGHGHAMAGEVMRAVLRAAVDDALRAVDRSHAQLLRDRETLDAASAAAGILASALRSPAAGPLPVATGPGPRTVGSLARYLGLSPATLRAWERAGVLSPGRDRATGHRIYAAEDVRDAELAHLLRRGGLPLGQIAVVVRELRSAGGSGALAASLADRRAALSARGRAMLVAAARLADYLAWEDDAQAVPST